ncbi:hypothetical protein [Flavobacterium beibuense]|uniref:Uncharacterized protein n=1 Tax=Flavobacterium beibuense TaxID=657326 RepID=A0A444WFG2_9FLAO|nr:hypothetical protein [Flavobacterium beibuense]RYJ44535.1 hypothetical protein NU09_1145 [Flavobacterium beibuense]
MKRLLLLPLLLFYVVGFAQADVTVSFPKLEFRKGEKIQMEVTNNTIDTLYVTFGLQRLNEKSGEWDSYRKDAFSKPHVKAEFCLVVKAGESLEKSFEISESEWLRSPQYTDAENRRLLDEAKRGTYRLEARYWRKEQKNRELIYTEPFVVK